MIRWHESFNGGDVSFLLVTIAIQFFIIWPALILFYGGLTGRRDLPELSIHLLPLLALMSIAWCLWGFSLAFAPGPGTVPRTNAANAIQSNMAEMMAIEDAKKDETGTQGRGGIVGGDDYLNFNSHLPVTGSGQPIFPSRRPHFHVPHLLFLALHMMLFVAAPTPLLLLLVGRIRPIGIFSFAVLWGSIVYSPLAHWVWGDGWLESLGVVDSSGGLLHIGVGFSALACALVFMIRGPRHSRDRSDASHDETSQNDNRIVTMMINLGTLAYWGGTSLVNGALTMHADGRAVTAFMNSHIAAASGAVAGLIATWLVRKRADEISACTGAFAGLVGVSAGCSFILPQTAMITGGIAAGLSVLLGELFRAHRRGRESFLIFVLQGVAGSIGCLLVGVFATSSIAGFRWDRLRLIEGAIEGNSGQIGLQSLGFAAAALWGFLATLVILTTVSFLFGEKNVENPASHPGLALQEAS